MIYRSHADLCVQLAQRSTFDRVRIGSVLTRRRRVISIGFNKIKTHPLTLKHGYKPGAGIHAEMDSCLGVDRTKIDGCTIYVVRIKCDGTWGMSRPCGGCMNLLIYLNVKSVVYSTGNGYELKEEDII